MDVINVQPLEKSEQSYSSKPELLHVLMDDYGEEIKRLVFTYTKNWAQAEDITQEIFLSVFKNLDSFREQANVKTWIYRIALNKCKDYVRSWHYKKTVITEIIFSSETDDSPETVYLHTEQKQMVSQLILQLPIKYREVIVLYYFKDLSMEEASAVLGMNLNTLKSRLRRAKMMLESKLRLRGGL
jgi:RNA polymerase sigma-70 factor (ECF subfamily)